MHYAKIIKKGNFFKELGQTNMLLPTAFKNCPKKIIFPANNKMAFTVKFTCGQLLWWLQQTAAFD